MSHTPGPYKVEEDKFCVMVFDATGNTIAEFNVDSKADAEFYESVDAKIRPITKKEARANAALFVAAAEGRL